MTDAKDFSKDVEALRAELASLRADWARVGGTAEDDGGRPRGVAEEAGDASEAIGEDVDELGVLVQAFAAKARKTIAARPLYSLLGAVAFGVLLGRIVR